jgi:DNA mismatch repair ATPase MutS
MDGNAINHATDDNTSMGERPGPLDDAPVIMAAVRLGSCIAFAAYNEDANAILLEEITASGSKLYSMIERVVAIVRPTLLLLSTKVCSDEATLEALRTPPPNGNTAQESAQGQGSIPYTLLKTSTFELRACKAHILQMRVDSLSQNVGTGLPPRHYSSQDEHAYKMSNFHSIATLIDFDRADQVQAVGSLLSFLKNGTFRCVTNGAISVDDIVRVNASLHMTVSSDAFTVLHIFSTEHHPLVAAKGCGKSKEGFSLFSLLDRTKSHAGSRMLREWMLKPLADTESIERRQDGVEMFLLSELRPFADNIHGLLKSIGAIDKILLRIMKCCTSHKDVLALFHSLKYAMEIAGLLQTVLEKLHQKMIHEHVEAQFHEDSPSESNGERRVEQSARNYVDCVTDLLQRSNFESLHNLSHRISSVIDVQATCEAKSIVIQPGQDNLLDELKEIYMDLDST